MSKAERGTKRVCGECGARYYDLNRDPIVCPQCEAVFVVEVPVAKAKAPVVEKKPEEKEEVAAKPEKAEADAPETVSLEELESDDKDDDDDEPDLEDVVIDLDDDDDDIGDEDDTFLDDDEDDDSGVADIIPGKVKSEDEG